MKPFELVIDVFTTNEYGDSPAYAVVEVTPLFLDEVARLSELCRAHALTAVEVSASPERWDAEDEFRLQDDALHVQKNVFWFAAYPKHADYDVETRGIDIKDLRKIAEAGPGIAPENDSFQWSDGRLYFAGCAELAKDLSVKFEEQNNEQ